MKPLRLLAVFALSCACLAFGQTVQPIVQPHVSFVDSTGLPCSGCSLYTYSAGTTTLLATYRDPSGPVANENPIILDTTGSATVWVLPGSAYKFVVKNTLGNTVWTTDNVTPPSFCPTGCKINGQISFGVLPAAHLSFTNLSTMPGSWTFDYTSPQTAMNSIANGGATTAAFNALTLGGNLPPNHLNFTSLSVMPASWTFDYTTPQTAVNSLTNSSTTNAYFGGIGSKTSPVHSVLAWGAKCDGTTDDSAAILSAIASSNVSTSNAGAALSLPSTGLCRVTQPILFTTDNLVQILGTGTSSGLLCDYSAWVGTDYTCLEYKGTSGHFSEGEVFSNFTVQGVNNASVVSTGVKIYHSLDHNGGAFKIVGLKVDNVRAQGFDTGFSVSDVTQSTFRHLMAVSTRLGFSLIGQNVNDTFDGLTLDTPTNAFTSSVSATQGIFVDGKTYPDTVFYSPEGINLLNSVILSAANDLTIGGVLEMSVSHNIFDLATANTVVLGQSDGGPRNVRFLDNYVYSTGTSAHLIDITTPSTNQGLTIENNYILGGGTGQTGINVGSSLAWTNVHIGHNRLQALASPIALASVLDYSDIRDNWGTGNSGPFLVATPTGSCGPMFQLSGNSSTDAYDIADITCTGGIVGTNYSSTQTTGTAMSSCGNVTFAASATSPSLSCGPVTTGSHCNATWVGTGVSGGALGYTLSAGSITLTAQNANSGTAHVACSVN